MNPNDILLLGMKKRVAAVRRTTGKMNWETKLRGGQGDCVTLLCEEGRVFACAGGHPHCLDLAAGTVLWTNKLAGLRFRPREFVCAEWNVGAEHRGRGLHCRGAGCSSGGGHQRDG